MDNPSEVVESYVKQIQSKEATIDDIPLRYREEVNKQLESIILNNMSDTDNANSNEMSYSNGSEKSFESFRNSLTSDVTQIKKSENAERYLSIMGEQLNELKGIHFWIKFWSILSIVSVIILIIVVIVSIS